MKALLWHAKGTLKWIVDVIQGRIAYNTSPIIRNNPREYFGLVRFWFEGTCVVHRFSGFDGDAVVVELDASTVKRLVYIDVLSRGHSTFIESVTAGPKDVRPNFQSASCDVEAGYIVKVKVRILGDLC